MKDFAKSIVCNTKTEAAKVVNANYRYKGYLITKSDEDGEIIVFKPNGRDVAFRGTKSESMAKDWIDHHEVGNTKVGNSNKAEIIEKKKKEGATLKVDNGQKLEFSDGSTYVKTSFSDDYREAHNYTGNKKVGNGITKFGLGTYVIADGHKAIVLRETVEQGPNGIPFGWVTIRWVEGPWKGQSDQQYDYDLKKA